MSDEWLKPYSRESGCHCRCCLTMTYIREKYGIEAMEDHSHKGMDLEWAIVKAKEASDKHNSKEEIDKMYGGEL